MTTTGAAPAGYALACRVMSTAQDLLTERPDLAPQVEPIIQWLRAPDVGTCDYGAALLDKGDTIAALVAHPPRAKVTVCWLDGMNQERAETARRVPRLIPADIYARQLWPSDYQWMIRYKGAYIPATYTRGRWHAFADDTVPLDHTKHDI